MRTIRNIIYGITIYLFTLITIHFIFNDSINPILEAIMFGMMEVFLNWYSFRHGMKTCRENLEKNT